MPNSEYLLVLEHSCIKHVQRGELQRAREVKQVRDWQAANRQEICGALPGAEKVLQEALAARAASGKEWQCDPSIATLRLVHLKIGADPQASNPFTDSFVSNGITQMAIDAAAEIVGDPCADCSVQWSVTMPQYQRETMRDHQTHLMCNQDIPAYPKGDRGEVAVEIVVQLTRQGQQIDELRMSVHQHENDQLRQEYIDMQKQNIPHREALLSEHNTEHFSLREFNSSRRVGGGQYRQIPCAILEELEQVHAVAGNVPMIINSGFRNPYKQKKVSSARESLHIYGLAADIARRDFNKDGKQDNKDWDLMFRAAKHVGACVEPITLASTWIHMDWRGPCPNGW